MMREMVNPLREHPLESLIAAGLLLMLLVGASDGAAQKPEQNQAVSACAVGTCGVKQAG